MAVAWMPAVAGAQALPTRLADTTFWRLVTTFSEPGGFFQADNFVSNEWELQYEIPAVRKRVASMGAYVGVGPEQNLTYIAALQPSIAFIVDIRRQNMIQHLMYKALIEMSADRADFLSRLWSRARPDGLNATTSTQQLVGAYEVAVKDSALYHANLAAIFRRLVDDHRFTFSAEDSASLRYVFGAFFTYGHDITYSHRSSSLGGVGVSPGPLRTYTFTIRSGDSTARTITRVDTLPTFRGTVMYGGLAAMPSFADLMVADDGVGTNHGWLASEESFRVLKDYHARNLIVPLVGNFAGPVALRAVGRYLKEHRTTMSVFYLSNVEQYLFQLGDEWKRFYDNVAAMPYDSTSTFIRSVTNPRYLQPRHPRSRMAQMSASVDGLMRAFSEGRIAGYYDVIMLLR